MRTLIFLFVLSACSTDEYNSHGGIGGLSAETTFGPGYKRGLDHLAALTAEARTLTVAAPCDLAIMRRSPGVYASSPFDRIADAWAVHDFMIGPLWNAYETSYADAYDAAARALIGAREAADANADACP